eukprot:9493561-Pyramimonas_sp.AAC.2
MLSRICPATWRTPVCCLVTLCLVPVGGSPTFARLCLCSVLRLPCPSSTRGLPRLMPDSRSGCESSEVGLSSNVGVLAPSVADLCCCESPESAIPDGALKFVLGTSVFVA